MQLQSSCTDLLVKKSDRIRCGTQIKKHTHRVATLRPQHTRNMIKITTALVVFAREGYDDVRRHLHARVYQYRLTPAFKSAGAPVLTAHVSPGHTRVRSRRVGCRMHSVAKDFLLRPCVRLCLLSHSSSPCSVGSTSVQSIV